MGKTILIKKNVGVGISSINQSSLVGKVVEVNSTIKKSLKKKKTFINKIKTKRLVKQNWLIASFSNVTTNNKAVGWRKKNSLNKFDGVIETFSKKHLKICSIKKVKNFIKKNTLKYYGLNLILNKRSRGFRSFGNLKFILTSLQGSNSFLGTFFNAYSSHSNFRNLNTSGVIQRGLRLLFNRSFKQINFGVIERTKKNLITLGLISKLKPLVKRSSRSGFSKKRTAIKKWKAFLYTELKEKRFKVNSTAVNLLGQIEKRGDILKKRYKWSSRGALRARYCKLVRYNFVKQFSKLTLNNLDNSSKTYFKAFQSKVPALTIKNKHINHDFFLNHFKPGIKEKVKLETKAIQYGNLFSKYRGDLILLKDKKINSEVPRFKSFKNQSFLKSMVKLDFLTVYNRSQKDIFSNSGIENGLKLFNSESFLGLNILELNLQLKNFIQQLLYIRLFPNYKIWFWAPNKFIADLIQAFLTRFLLNPDSFSVSVNRPDIPSSRNSDKINLLIILGDVWSKNSKSSIWKYLNSKDLSLVTLMSLTHDRHSFGLQTILNDVFDYKKLFFILSIIWNVLMVNKNKVVVSSLLDKADDAYLKIVDAPNIQPVVKKNSVELKNKAFFYLNSLDVIKQCLASNLELYNVFFFEYSKMSTLKIGFLKLVQKELSLEEKIKYVKHLVKNKLKNSKHLVPVLIALVKLLPNNVMITDINTQFSAPYASKQLTFPVFSKLLSPSRFSIFNLFLNVRALNSFSKFVWKKKKSVKKFKKKRILVFKQNLLKKPKNFVKKAKEIKKLRVISKKTKLKFKKNLKKICLKKKSKNTYIFRVKKNKKFLLVKSTSIVLKKKKVVKKKKFKFLTFKKLNSLKKRNFLNLNNFSYRVSDFEKLRLSGLSVNKMLSDVILKKGEFDAFKPSNIKGNFKNRIKHYNYIKPLFFDVLPFKKSNKLKKYFLPVNVNKLKFNPKLSVLDPRLTRRYDNSLLTQGFLFLGQILGRKYNSLANEFTPLNKKNFYTTKYLNSLKLRSCSLVKVIKKQPSLVGSLHSNWLKNLWDFLRIRSLFKYSIQLKYNTILDKSPWLIGKFNPKSRLSYKLLGKKAAYFFRRNSMRAFPGITSLDKMIVPRVNVLPMTRAFFTKDFVLKYKRRRTFVKLKKKLIIFEHPVYKNYFFYRGQNSKLKIDIEKVHALSNNDVNKPGRWVQNLKGVKVFVSKPLSEFTAVESAQFSNKVRKQLYWKENKEKLALNKKDSGKVNSSKNTKQPWVKKGTIQPYFNNQNKHKKSFVSENIAKNSGQADVSSINLDNIVTKNPKKNTKNNWKNNVNKNQNINTNIHLDSKENKNNNNWKNNTNSNNNVDVNNTKKNNSWKKNSNINVNNDTNLDVNVATNTSKKINNWKSNVNKIKDISNNLDSSINTKSKKTNNWKNTVNTSKNNINQNKIGEIVNNVTNNKTLDNVNLNSSTLKNNFKFYDKKKNLNKSNSLDNLKSESNIKTKEKISDLIHNSDKKVVSTVGSKKKKFNNKMLSPNLDVSNKMIFESSSAVKADSVAGIKPATLLQNSTKNFVSTNNVAGGSSIDEILSPSTKQPVKKIKKNWSKKWKTS